jgi:excisionase family DNA binding protein
MPGNHPIHALGEEHAQLAALRDYLDGLGCSAAHEQQDRCEFTLTDPEAGSQMALPGTLIEVLARAARVLADGGAVAVLPYHAKLTTQEAANYLGVSRPYFISLLDEGVIPYQRLRSHQRILLSDVEAYRKRRDAERREILDEMARESFRLGFYDLPEDVDLADLGIDE